MFEEILMHKMTMTETCHIIEDFIIAIQSNDRRIKTIGGRLKIRANF